MRYAKAEVSTDQVELASHPKRRPPIAASAAAVPPLCIDLDKALILTDILLESLLLLIKRNPLYVSLLPIWLLRGPGALQAALASRATPNPDALPYDSELIRWLEGERRAGRSLWLCTALNERLAECVAAHMGLFDGIVASSTERALLGNSRAAALVERFGERGFDYCGSEGGDIEVWKHARGMILCDRGWLKREVPQHAQLLRTFQRRASPLRSTIRALRPHQWAKNALVLVPLLAAHRAGDLTALTNALLAAAAFCCCASSVYILNDLLDLEADRAHPQKSKRPFAAGTLSLTMGLVLAPSLLVSAMAIAMLLSHSFQLLLASYYALTVTYSFALKRMVLIDAIALAGLYTLRIIAGASAVDVPLSFWMLLFSVFLFLSLAFVKRFAELDLLRTHQRLRAAGRGYHVEDLPSLQTLGSASGYVSVLVLALYINSADIQALYHRPKVIWVLCLLMLCWISRVWLTAQRGEMHHDPIIFALRDRMSLSLALLATLTIAAAI